jgi:predicted metal-binding protein
MFGCDEYGHNAACPLNVPSVPECRQFFSEYSTGVIFHFQKTVDKPKDRFDWTEQVNRGLVDLEHAVFRDTRRPFCCSWILACSAKPAPGQEWNAKNLK